MQGTESYVVMCKLRAREVGRHSASSERDRRPCRLFHGLLVNGVYIVIYIYIYIHVVIAICVYVYVCLSLSLSIYIYKHTCHDILPIAISVFTRIRQT